MQHHTHALVNALLGLLPTPIERAPRPFGIECDTTFTTPLPPVATFARPFDIDLHTLLRVRTTLLKAQRELRAKGCSANPATCRLLAEQLVGLHYALLHNTAKLSRQARNLTTKAGLMAMLVDTYDLVEPLLA